MEFIRGLHNIRPRHFGSVVSIGNFDGVHLGHHALLNELKIKSRQYNLPAIVIFFEPQPNEFFAHHKITTRIMKLREKIVAIAEQQIDHLLCIRFNQNFAALSAEQFVEDILVRRLGTRAIIVGDDFKFGYQRSGDYQLLDILGRKLNFETICIPPFKLEGDRVSSTRIRQYLAQGDMQRAKRFLGKSFTMMGRVIHGDKRGRIIGVPTANIQLHRKAVPVSGVFVVQVHGLVEGSVQGVANVGTRPTVDGTKTLLEVHLFDFERMIYGEHVEVEFIHKLRNEERFASFDELVAQIHRDVTDAKQYLLRTTS